MSRHKSESTGLTPTEIAALTARVPCSGNPEIDAIITQSLRFSVATECLAALVSRGPVPGARWDHEKVAVEWADALLQEFRHAPEN